MPPRPVPADPGWDDDPARCVPEPEGPWWEDEEDPGPEDELTAEELAEIRGGAGAARRPAFGSGMALDVMPSAIGSSPLARPCSGPALTWTCCWARIPGPARTLAAGTAAPSRAAPQAADREAAGGSGRSGRFPGRRQAAGAAPGGFAGRVTLTVPLATLTDLAGRPGEIPGIGPVDPALARDLARAAAQNPGTTWCVTVTDEHGHAIGHGCARPEPSSHRKRAGPAPPGGHGNRDGPEFTFTGAAAGTGAGGPGPPGGYGTWRLRTPGPGPDLLVTLDPITTGPCDHRFEARGHDPGVKLRHLAEVRHATCTAPVCRRPAATCDFEHNIPYEAGGRSCLCNGGPKCRHDHRLKQHPRWHVDQLPDATFRWTTPSGRQYTTEPTRYPI